MRIPLLSVSILLVLSFLVGAETRYRGVNVPLENTDYADLEHLATAWNVNLIRVVLNAGENWRHFIADPALPGLIPERDWLRLDSLLDDCEELGIRVAICLHQWLGYEYLEDAQDDSLWRDPQHQESLVGFWRTLAERYSDRGDVIYGYDILNEPWARFNWRTYSTDLWTEIAERVTAAIREADGTHAVIVETPMYGNPLGFEGFTPIRGENVIYSFHFYQTEEFVGQGMPGLPVGVTYPDSTWNKNRFREELRFAVAFEDEYGSSVFVGEIGASAYADPISRAAFLNDAFSLFEEYGFDYCLWSYSEEAMWSVEHAPCTTEGIANICFAGNTAAYQVIIGHFSQNNFTASAIPDERSDCLFDQTGWQEDSWETKVSKDLLWRATRLFDISEHVGPFTKELVHGFDVVIVGAHRGGFSAGEVDVLVQHVEQGGGLLYYGGIRDCPGVDRLLTSFNINPGDYAVLSDPFDSNVGSYWADPAESHEICDDVQTYRTSWPVSLTPSDDGFVLVWSPEESWLDMNGDRRRSVSEPQGSQSLAVAVPFGEGRVIAFGDSCFWNPANYQIAMNALAWLADSSQ